MTEAIIAGAVAGAVAGAIVSVAIGYFARQRPERWRGVAVRSQTEFYRQPGASGADIGRAAIARPATIGPTGPYGRFDESAKRVLALAQDEARRLNHAYVGTEHLLLGLMREGEGTAGRVLHELGGDLAVLRRQVEAAIGRGEATVSESEIMLGPQYKKAIELAIDEARKRGHTQIRTEHLLLAISRDFGSSANRVLEAAGIKPAALRERLLAVLGVQHVLDQQRPTGGGPFSRFDSGAKHVLALAQDEAIRFDHNYLGTEHLLLGLLREDQAVAAQVLVANGVDLAKARTAVGFIIPRGESTASPSEITLSPRTKKVIELSVAEADRLNHVDVGPAHLLLGLVREGEGIACGVIESLGVPLEKLRQDVLRTLS